MEIWKDISGYENVYLASNLGRIKSLPKKTRKGERVLSPIKGVNYFTVDLVKDKKVKKYLVHRLIAETFIGNLENKPQVNHINGIKTDNRIENLEWVTRSENQLHSIRAGLRTTNGIKNSQCKLSEKEVLIILNDNRKYKYIAEQYNTSIPTISDIKRGYSWTHLTGLRNIKTSKHEKNMQI